MARISKVQLGVEFAVSKAFGDFIGRRHTDESAYFLRNKSHRDFLAWAFKQQDFGYKDIRREFLGVKSHPWVSEALETGWINALGAHFTVSNGMPVRILNGLEEAIGQDSSHAPSSEYEISTQVICIARPVYLHVYQRIASKPRTTHELKVGFMCSRDQMVTALNSLQGAGLIRQKWEGLSRMWVPSGQKMPGLVGFLKSLQLPLVKGEQNPSDSFERERV
jgi:hypothetical protein